MNKLGRIAAIAVLPLLAGCFDASQSIVVAPDGTTTVTMEVAVAPAESILAMILPPEQLAAIPQEQVDQMVADMEADRGEALCAPEEGEVPEGFTATVETFIRDDGYEVCRATMVGPISELGEAIGEEGDTTITFTDEGGGVYFFSFYLPIPEDADDTGLIDPETDAMIAAATEGRFITMSITAPRIIETSGTLEGNTATYQIPAFALLGAPEEAYEFTVRFALN